MKTHLLSAPVQGAEANQNRGLMSMKFAVLGAGNTGKAYSVFLTQLGCQVTLYDRSPERLAPLSGGITASGAVSGVYPVRTASDLKEAADCEVILVCTVAAGHRPLAAGLKGLLRPGQLLVVTNCCWGAVEFDQELGREADEKGCVIAEMGGQLILCNSPAPDSVYVKTVKKSMSLACVRPGDTPAALERLAPVFPQLYGAANVLETSLNNSNPVSHGPLALFNITRMENGEDFLLFGTGATRGVTRFMEKIDRERTAVVRACGVSAPTELDMLNSFWPEPQASIYDVLHNTPAYSVTKGPKTLNHRYLTEDLPFGLAPYIRLGKKLGVETPCLSALVEMFSLYMDQDYLEQGPAVERLDLSRYLG